jgi:hypothetical protein
MAKGKGQKTVKKDTKKPAPKKPVKTDNKSSFNGKKFLPVVAIVLIIAVVGILWVTVSADEVVTAQLRIEYGTVEVKHSGESWTAAEDGMILYQSDSIKTGEDTYASVVLFESSIIRLDNNTEITLTEIIQTAEETSVTIDQDAGRTWSTISKISGMENYEVQTSTTVASTRGTSFDTNVSGNETTIGVGSGTVNVTIVQNGSAVNSTDVNKDQSVVVDPENQTFYIGNLTKDGWILRNLHEDEEFLEQVKAELYNRIAEYIPEIKEKTGITDEELDTLLEGYLLGYIDLPEDTPQWIRDLIELS